jgi:hypothetical protein
MSQTCSHIYDTGGTCKSFAVTGQRYCVHHLRYRARRLRMAQAHARGERFEFNLPPLESMHAVHSALSQLAEAIARGVVDDRSANDLLSVLRVASRNLLHPEKWQESLYHSEQPAPDVDVAAEFGLPAELDLDTPPAVAFPPDEAHHRVILSEDTERSEGDESKDPFVLAGSSGLPPLPEMPFSGSYCGDHQSRECECCRIRPHYPITPEMVEVVEVTETHGPEVAAVRSRQLMRNTERRRLNREHKRYEAIALERNMRRAVEVMTERKLAERVTCEESAASQPPTSAPADGSASRAS